MSDLTDRARQLAHTPASHLPWRGIMVGLADKVDELQVIVDRLELDLYALRVFVRSEYASYALEHPRAVCLRRQYPWLEAP